MDDEVLTALCDELGQPQLTPTLIAAKRTALQNSINSSGPVDDFKRPAGDIYNSAKQLFPNHKLGSNKRAFMKGLCAPLIKQGTAIYAELRNDIFGP